MLLSVRKRKDIFGNGDAYGPAVVDLGCEKPVSEDNPRGGTTNRYSDSFAFAFQRNKASGRIGADGERQAPEVARADFCVGARAKYIQATIQLFGKIQRFVIVHVIALRFILN